MSDLRELYQTTILDHHRQPRYRGRLEHPTGSAQGYNPLCGDRIQLDVKVAGGAIEDVRFEGSGCAISTASASLMTQAVKHKPVSEALKLFERFHAMITSNPETPADDLGKLSVLAGVREFPTRVKCASLAWHTMKAAVAHDSSAPVSTE